MRDHRGVGGGEPGPAGILGDIGPQPTLVGEPAPENGVKTGGAFPEGAEARQIVVRFDHPDEAVAHGFAHLCRCDTFQTLSPIVSFRQRFEIVTVDKKYQGQYYKSTKARALPTSDCLGPCDLMERAMTVFDKDFTMTIDGRSAAIHDHFDVIDPATATVVAKAPDCTREQLDQAVASARGAFSAWSRRPLAERQKLILKLADAMESAVDDLARLLTLEQGKPLAEAQGEILNAAGRCRVLAGFDIPAVIVEDSPQRRIEMLRVPIGVVAALSPWNFPLGISVMKSASALLAGNTVVLKPSPFTPLTTLKMGEIARDILPAGTLNVITGGDDLGPWLTSHPGIDKITFTGSTRTGRKVMESAAATLKRVTLELGGNDAAIVLPDVDIDAVTPLIFWSAFRNAGQVCIASKRVYVHADIYDRLRDALIAYGQTVVVGSGLEQGVQMGPLQNRQQYDRVRALVDEARANQTVVLGGEPLEGPGYFIAPMLIDNPPSDSRIVTEEQFGPIMPLLRFEDIDQVVEQVNATPYGLGGTIWTADEAAGRALANRIDSGTVWINSPPAPAVNAPFSGRRQSGVGAEGGFEGLLEYTEIKMVYTIHAAA
jgi:aldehyde dehydrogenase (NAD+)